MKYANDMPYPNIEQLEVNIKLGQMMLSHLGGVHSKINTVSLFFYNQIIVEESWKELSEVFHQIALVDMKHLQVFAKICYKLGVDPRLWDCHDDFLDYWSPGYNVYPRRIKPMIENAIIQKQNTIKTYQNQIYSIDEPIIQDMLNRILLDEEIHIDILNLYLQQCIEKNFI